MSRVQLALNVSNLGSSIEFYSKLLQAEPAKVRPGYANFAIVDPPLKLVLIEQTEARCSGLTGALNHLGVEVETPDEVASSAARLSERRHGHRCSRQHNLLLRPSGQGLG